MNEKDLAELLFKFKELTSIVKVLAVRNRKPFIITRKELALINDIDLYSHVNMTTGEIMIEIKAKSAREHTKTGLHEKGLN